MKRLFLVLLVLAILLGVAWLLGKAPSRYVLEQEAVRFYEARRKQDGQLSLRITRLERETLKGKPPVESLGGLKRKRDLLHRTPRRTTMRGWDVLLIPAGAPRPPAEDFLIVGRHDPSGPLDPQRLRGGMEIWIQPNGALAKLVSGLGLAAVPDFTDNG